MTDYVIILLLAVLVMENSRFGVAIASYIVLQCAHVRHFLNHLVKGNK
jgi:hypothetical protein